MPVVIVRCDGNAAIGMGHVSRCLALAIELRDRQRCAVTFAMRDISSAGAVSVADSHFDVDPIRSPDEADYGAELADLIQSHGAAALVVDVRDALSRGSLDLLRRRGVRVIVIDDATDRRLASDFALYPRAPQVERMNWTGYTGRVVAGWECVLIGRDFASASFTPPELSAESPAIDVLITMGGSDPAGMTEFVVSAMDRLPMPLAVRVVVGPAFARAERLIDAIARSKHSVQVARAPASLAPLMRASRMAVAAFGVTAYELAACGVPAVHLCLTADHATSSEAFAREGAGVTVGVFGEVTPDEVADAVRRLMSAAGRRGQMAKRASRLVDGRGAERVAALVAAGL